MRVIPMIKGGFNKLHYFTCMFQVEPALKVLEKYLKEADISSGRFTQSSIFSAYIPDVQYILRVWLPEVTVAGLYHNLQFSILKTATQ